MISRRESLKYITLASISTGYLAGCTVEEAEHKMPEVSEKYPILSEADKELLTSSWLDLFQ